MTPITLTKQYSSRIHNNGPVEINVCTTDTAVGLNAVGINKLDLAKIANNYGSVQSTVAIKANDKENLV